MLRLEFLFERDEEKKRNEQAKNALESHIFEMQDFMYSDDVTQMSSEEERTAILSALTETSDWLYDEGEYGETRVCSSLHYSSLHLNVHMFVLMYSLVLGILSCVFISHTYVSMYICISLHLKQFSMLIAVIMYRLLLADDNVI